MPLPEQITLIICTHNRGTLLARTLEAVQRLRDPQRRIAELVVVNNASTDDTPGVVDRLIATGPPIRTRRVDEPRVGAIHARRRGVAEAATPLIAWLDDDVIPASDWAERVLSRFDENPEAGLVGSRITLRFDSPPTPLTNRFRTQLAEQELGDEAFALTRPTAGLATAALAARRQAVLDSGWMDEAFLCGPSGSQLSRGEDYEMVIRARRAGWPAWYEPTARVDHLIPDARQTPAYLRALAIGIGQAMPWLRWLAEGRPDVSWTEAHIARVARRLRRTELLEWRPHRRFVRMNDRRGRLEGLQLLREFQLRQAPPPAAVPALVEQHAMLSEAKIAPQPAQTAAA